MHPSVHLQESFYGECLDASSRSSAILVELTQFREAQLALQLDLSSVDGASAARSEYAKLRDRLINEYSHKVEESVKEADRLCIEGAETLSAEQFHQIKEIRHTLWNSFETLVKQTSAVLDRLDVATVLLIEFSTKASQLQSWLFDKSRVVEQLRAEVSPNRERLDAVKLSFKSLDEEIVSRRDELSALSQLAIKIEVEICNYIEGLRRKEREGVPVQPSLSPGHTAAPIGTTVTRIQNDYAELVRSKNELWQFINKMKHLFTQYEQCSVDIGNWLAELERNISSALISSKDPEDRLANLLHLHQLSVQQSHNEIEPYVRSTRHLIDAYSGTPAHERVQKEYEEGIVGVQRRFEGLRKKIADGMDVARAEITQKDGLDKGIDSFNDWLADAEANMVDSNRLLPLDGASLQKMKYEEQLKRSEAQSKGKTLEELFEILDRLKQSGPASARVKNAETEQKLFSAKQRYERLDSALRVHGDNLTDLISSLQTMQSMSAKIKAEIDYIAGEVEGADVVQNKGELGRRLDRLSNEDWPALRELAQKVLAIPNIRDAKSIHEMLHGIESSLSNVRKAFENKLACCKEVAERNQRFTTEADSIGGALDGVESKVGEEKSRLTLSLPGLQLQHGRTIELRSELHDIHRRIEEVEELGEQLLRAGSNNNAAPPKRRSTVDAKDAELASSIAKRIFQLRRREEVVEKSLDNLAQRISQNDEKRREWNAKYEALDRWLTGEHAHLANLRQQMKLLSSPEALQRQTSQHIDRQRERQPEMTALQLSTQHLLQLTDDADSKREVTIELEQLLKKWKELGKECSDLEKCSRLVEALTRDMSGLNKWLASKSKMIGEVCVATADSNIINSHLIILEVVNREYAEEEPRRVKFNDIAGEVVNTSNSDAVSAEVVAAVDEVNLGWKGFGESLSERKKKLDQLKALSTSFDAIHRDVKRDLSTIEASANRLTTQQGSEHEKLDALSHLERTLADVRPRAEQLRELSERIEEAVADANATAPIRSSAETASVLMDELERKLENIRRAIESANEEEGQIFKQLDDLIAWTDAHKSRMDEAVFGQLHTESTKLADQMEKLAHLHSELLAKDNEIIITTTKTSDILNRSFNAALNQKLRTLNEQWPSLLASAKTRYQRMDKWKMLVTELAELETDVKVRLTSVRTEIEELREDKKSADPAMSAETIDGRLVEVDSRLRSAAGVLGKMEATLREDLSDRPVDKIAKVRLVWDDFRRQHDALLADSTALANEGRKRDALRAQLESEVELAQDVLESARKNFLLDRAESVGMGAEALNIGLADFNMKWQRSSATLESVADQLSKIADASERDELREAIGELQQGADEVRAQFDGKLARLKQEASSVQQLEERQGQLADAIGQLVDRCAVLEPVARDLDTLSRQAGDCDAIGRELEEHSSCLGRLNQEWKEAMATAREGMIPVSQSTAALKEIDRLGKQLDKGRTAIRQRSKSISSTSSKIRELNSGVNALLADMDAVAGSEPLRGCAANADLPALRQQRDAVDGVKMGEFRIVTAKKEQLLDAYRELIRTAAAQVSTQELESQVKRLDSGWQKLSALMEECERRLEAAIQGAGSYTEASRSLSNWLEEAEELISNQKPPSSDPKVIRAQLNNIDFQLKLIDDKQSNVDGFLALAERLQKSASSDSQREQYASKANEVSTRYNHLLEMVNGRRRNLQEAQVLAQEFSELAHSLTDFLNDVDKALLTLGQIPTDAERLKAQIQLQRDLQQRADGQRANFDRLVVLCSELVKLVGVEDANELEATVHSLSSRYNEIGTRCRNCGNLLATLAEDITSFLNNTTLLAEWLANAEQELRRFEEMPIDDPAKLIEQSEQLTKLAIAFAEQGALVSQVVEDSRELCSHASGSEAVALQYKINQLRLGYSKLAAEAEERINAMSKAIPLSEDLKEGYDDLRDFLKNVEGDLEGLEMLSADEKFNLLSGIDGDCQQFRTHLESLQSMALELQRLSSDAKAAELAKESSEISQNFSAVADMVSRKLVQLRDVDRQSRYTFDVLDFWIDWFVETSNSITQAEKPSVDMQFLKAQLKEQRLLNHEIANERAGLRDVILEASRVMRELTVDGHEEALIAKIERAKKLAEETAELGHDRTMVLEQAFALCKELDSSYTELNDWMDEVERELGECDPITTGMSPKVLLQQQIHNNNMLQSIQNQRPLFIKFERNAHTLGEMCSEQDSANLRQISEQLMERFQQLTSAFRERGDALGATIEQSSHFSDRLDVFLSNLEGAAGQIRASDPPSCRPQFLRRQLDDNISIMELLKAKEGAFATMKESAQEVMVQTKGNETTTREVAINIERLDDLWLELHSGAVARDKLLREALQRAERFWTQFEVQQSAAHQLREIFDGIPTGAVDPELIAANQQTLLQAELTVREVDSGMGTLKQLGGDLCALPIADEERQYVEQHIHHLQSMWAGVMAMHARLSSTLHSAMDRSAEFRSLLLELSAMLNDVERGQLSRLISASPSAGVEKIRDCLELIERIRTTLDEKSPRREQLNQVASELCASAQPSEAALVRSSTVELNQRWVRLVSTLNDRQHKLERCLLEMGQFSKAYEQFSAWMDKSLETLQAMNSLEGLLMNPKSLEVEICKFKFLQNDIASHRTSYDAIEKAASLIIKSEGPSSIETQQLLASLTGRWLALNRTAEELATKLEAARLEASRRGNELERWMLWLKDVLAGLSTSRPIGGLPETATAQLDEFRIIAADVDQRRGELDEKLSEIQHILASSHDKTQETWLEADYRQLKGMWESVQVKLTDREKRLKEALREAIEMEDGMHEMEEWLTEAENALSLMDPSQIPRLLSRLEGVLATHSKFHEDVHAHQDKLKELQNKGVRIQLSCEKKDAIPMKNQLVTLKHRTNKVVQRVLERTRQLDTAMAEARLFFNSAAELTQWMDASVAEIKGRSAQPHTGEHIKAQLEEHHAFRAQLQRRLPAYESTYHRGKLLEERAPPGEKKEVAAAASLLREKWGDLGEVCTRRQRSLEEALVQSGKFDEIVGQLSGWLKTRLPQLEAEVAGENSYGDVATLHALSKENYKHLEEVNAHRHNIDAIRERAAKISTSTDSKEAEKADVDERMRSLNEQWKRMETATSKKEEQLTAALKSAVDLDEMEHELKDALTSIEARLRRITLPSDEQGVHEETGKLSRLKDDFRKRLPEHERALELARHIHSKCHPRAELPMRELIRTLTGRWDLIEQLARDKGDKLKARLDEIKAHERKVNDLLDYTREKSAEFGIIQASDDHGELTRLETLVGELDMFLSDLRSRQPEVEEVVRVARRMAPPSAVSSAESETRGEKGQGLMSMQQKSSSRLKIATPRQDTSVDDKASPSTKRPLPQHPADELDEKWKGLFVDTRAYEDRLKERKSHLEEVKRLENFSFGEWRDRYLRWNDHGKARISDLFRRIDKSGAGKVPRKQFIEGILTTKFPTTELEMGKVSDEFDKGDGLISAKEFMNALRFDPRKRRDGPKSEFERIHEEVARENSRCTCAHRFPIQHISTDKDRVHYGFGFGSSMKRMVRILRSTVMVRVGGGWEPLEKFLEKHDPCRARGRTNLELYCDELRSGPMQDQMENFVMRRTDSSPHSSRTSLSGYGVGTSSSLMMGPVTKVREKTERSVPMFKRPENQPLRAPISQQFSIKSYSSRRDSENSSLAGSVLEDFSRIPRQAVEQPQHAGRSDSRPLSRASEVGSVELSLHTRIPSLRGPKGGHRNGPSQSSTQNNSPSLPKDAL